MKKNAPNDAGEGEETSNRDKRRNRKAGSDAEEREKKMFNGGNKAKSRKVSSPFFEKERKKKMLGMSSHQNGEQKKSNDDSDKKRTVPKVRHNDIMEMTIKEKKQDVSFVQPEERTSQTFSTNNKGKKRKALSTLFKREQKMREASSDDKKETKKTRIVAKGNDRKVCSDGKKKKRKASFTFLKFMCNKFKELLFIPPAVASSFKDLINHHVYLEDSEGMSSKIKLSVVDGSLAFYEGWNKFVSEHFITWGDFLLFEYTAESTFSVRVFGKDSCERLHFNVKSGRKGTMKKRNERYTLSDDLESHYDGQDSEDVHDAPHVSGESLRNKEPKITVATEIRTSNLAAKSINAASETQDSERVESGIGHGSVGALDNMDRDVGNIVCKTRSDSVLFIPETTKRSEVIMIIDESSSTQENEDTMTQMTSSEDSETRHMTINAKKDPERVPDGVWCKSSVALNNKTENVFLGECKNKIVSPTCSTEKTNGSETIPITDVIPLTWGNVDTFSHLKEGGSTREPELAAATPTKCTEIHDSDEDLRQRHQWSTVQVKSAIAMDRYSNNSDMDISGNISRIYEAPGGTRCLEKWNKSIISDRAALDDIEQPQVRPEELQKADKKLVDNCGAMGQNSVDPWLESDVTDTCLKPIENLLILDSRTEIDHFVNQKGAIVQLQTKTEPLKPTGSTGSIQGDKIPVCVNHILAQQSEEIPQQENGKFTSCVIPVALLVSEAKLLDLDDHSLQFRIPSTIQKWLELPKSLPITFRHKGRLDRRVVILKDPMKRLWPVFYHDHPIFVGFTSGWKAFAAANDLQSGDVCKLVKEPDEYEPAFQVQITRK
ncbi:B3 domain-containing protein Os02g0598200-like isoform X1 [Oryza brachyantha]|uniref:B3 domain-containing protein Os02g0598200-like isoform X1 n=1 Tax=Oryza brachyantha TaxID=4533 RepID=UPI001ADD12DB|nr:B3 domain-containing protein Os02g0598200-like isoform X1 [Oryza brachyantha]XP_040376462.1 B3 domain-containing protein Os02g0598200-like isoform X1 [Oryza brachyantha]XP_040376463.1 B3 domain-containing protein Os02g0598200-like isoform X1 [Oryza brachyantha]